MEIALSILSACLVACVVYIIQTQRNDFDRRQESTHRKLGEVNETLMKLMTEIGKFAARVAVLEDRQERSKS